VISELYNIEYTSIPTTIWCIIVSAAAAAAAVVRDYTFIIYYIFNVLSVAAVYLYHADRRRYIMMRI